jgi:hypothetical protein
LAHLTDMATKWHQWHGNKWKVTGSSHGTVWQCTFKTSNSDIKQLVREELTFKIFNARSCETLQQYKARTTDCSAKDLCDVSLRMQLQVQSMLKKTKKQKQDEDIEDDDRHRKK